MKVSERDQKLEIWMDEFGEAVYAAAFRILKNTQDSQDVFQNTFVKAYLKCQDYKEKEHVKAWLLKVAINESISLLRSGWKRRVMLTEIPEEVYDTVDGPSLMIEQVRKLPRKYREVLWLHYWAGYKTDEIATITGANPATVRTQLKRAREILKPRIQRSMENEYE